MTASYGQLLEGLRPRAFAIAYRMLGSVGDAEDLVQETLSRVHQALEAGERIDSPAAFAATVTTRLAIDHLRSARARRESYVGEWLPEPVVGEASDDPRRQAEMADSLSIAFLMLLEALSPEERAGRSRRAGPASRPRASGAASWRGGSSPPSGRATWRGSRLCSPTTWCCAATAARRPP